MCLTTLTRECIVMLRLFHQSNDMRLHSDLPKEDKM